MDEMDEMRVRKESGEKKISTKRFFYIGTAMMFRLPLMLLMVVMANGYYAEEAATAGHHRGNQPPSLVVVDSKRAGNGPWPSVLWSKAYCTTPEYSATAFFLGRVIFSCTSTAAR